MLVSVLFVIAVWTPLAEQVYRRGQNALSGENRRLAQAPRFVWNRATLKAYPRKFEAFYNDHFGLRRQLIRLHSLSYVFGLRVSPSERILIGKEGWYFYIGRDLKKEDPLADFTRTRPLTSAQLENWRTVLQERHDWLEARGIHYLVLLVPSKATVYPEYMPAGIRRADPPSPMEQMNQMLTTGTDLTVVDVTESLLAEKDRFRLYHRTDPHWNPCGGFIGYLDVMKVVSQWLPDVKPMSLDDVRVVRREYREGAVAQLLHIDSTIGEHSFELEPKQPLRSWQRKVSTVRWTWVGQTHDETLPKAIVVGDSFIGGLPPFFSEHFSRVVYRATYNRFPYSTIKKEEPVLVIEEVVERFLRDDLSNPEELVNDLRGLRSSEHQSQM